MSDSRYHKKELTLFSSDNESDTCSNRSDSDYDEPKKMFNSGNIPWVEKYRPEKLDDIIDHTEIINILKESITSGDLPHLLLYGPPGTGKTSTILATAREYFGSKIHDRVIELNASDDRGIKTVRESIITFAKTALGTPDPNYPSPEFKIVILDEADSMTPEAQAALRKVMEKQSHITRFCLMCNYEKQIIEPIVSRCMKLKFKLIKKDSLLKKIKYIAEQENLKISDECFDVIIKIAEGDARRTIMYLQNLQYMLKYKPNLTPEDIYQMNGNVDIKKFNNMWNICSTGTIYKIKELAENLIREGFVIKSILKYLMESVLDSNISEQQKSQILIELCHTDRRLSEGCSEYLQLLNILLYTNKIAKK
jgi:replication factor C subunit 2/4